MPQWIYFNTIIDDKYLVFHLFSCLVIIENKQDLAD